VQVPYTPCPRRGSISKP